MKKVRATVIAGRSFALTAEGIAGLCRDANPEPVRDHFVVVDGRRFPPKQVIALATGVDRNDFTTNQARSILRRLGFATGRARQATPARAGESAVPYRTGAADALRPYVGRWVALVGDQVLVAGATPADVLAQLRAAGTHADAMFRVPLDPGADIGGFAS